MKGNNNTKDINTTPYGYYSKLLKEPFDTLQELNDAEQAYLDKEELKAAAEAQEQADKVKLEEAYKDLIAARDAYKEGLNARTLQYSNELKAVQQSFQDDKEVLKNLLTAVEDNYNELHKAFLKKYPNGYSFSVDNGDGTSSISCKGDYCLSSSDFLKTLFGL